MFSTPDPVQKAKPRGIDESFSGRFDCGRRCGQGRFEQVLIGCIAGVRRSGREKGGDGASGDGLVGILLLDVARPFALRTVEGLLVVVVVSVGTRRVDGGVIGSIRLDMRWICARDSGWCGG